MTKRNGWKPGQSGNPKGKTPGSGELQRLRASIAVDVPEILAGLVLSAKSGDVQAARLILAACRTQRFKKTIDPNVA
jgi:hypothetical protein